MDSDEGHAPSPPPPSEAPPSLPPPPLPFRPRRPAPEPATPPFRADHAPDEPRRREDEEEDDEEEGEVSQQMTQSYSEISFRSGPASPQEQEEEEGAAEAGRAPPPALEALRPATLPCRTRPRQPFAAPLDLEGTVHVEGNMTHFVTEDLEYKIKLSSPVARKGSGNGADRPTLGQQLDAGLLNDLELEAQRMATSVDSLTESLCGILHSVSSITADNVDAYKNAVGKMSDAMDGNIKSMYTMMAKAEEVTRAMRAVHQHAARVKEIRRLVDLFETYV